MPSGHFVLLQLHSQCHSLSASGTRGLPGSQDPGLAVLGARVLPGDRGKGLRSLPGFGAMDVSKLYEFKKFGGPWAPGNPRPQLYPGSWYPCHGTQVVHTSRPLVG